VNEKGTRERVLRTVLHRAYPLFICLTLAVTLVVPTLASGNGDTSLPWRITADKLVHQQAPEKIQAEGNVLLQQYKGDVPTGLKIEADTIQYDVNQSIINGSGGIRLFEKNNEIRAAEARIELDRQIGIFKKASIFWRQNNLYANADLIERRAGGKYHFSGGRFTACPTAENQKPDWAIWGADIEISPDDYAKIKHATFRVRDIPVFYLPYLRLPIGKKKKTGFLFPEYSSSSRNGVGLITPFFINLSPSYDMTLYPGYYAERGPVLAGEFRYAAGMNSRGTFMLNYLDDDLEDTPGDDFKDDGYLRTNHNRYWFRGKADHDFGDRMVAKLDLDMVSDQDFLQEFNKGIIGFDRSNKNFLKDYNRGFQTETDDLRENTLQFAKVWATKELQTEVRIIDDERVAPDTPTPPWALPRLGYSGLTPFLDSPVDFVWDSEYVYYWRDESVGAHRVNFFPQLNGPLPISPYVEASYQAGMQETLYFIEPHDTEAKLLYDNDYDSRTFYNLQLSGATTLSRDFDISLGQYKKLRHAIRPELSYILVKGTGQDKLPLLDSLDRITEKNWLQFSINNYFRAITLDASPLFSSNFSSLKINQVYDLDADQHPFSDIYLEFIARGFRNLFFSADAAVSVYGEGVTAYNIRTLYANKRGDKVTLDYHYKKNKDIYPPYFYSNEKGESLSELKTYIESRLSQLFSVRFNNTYSLSSDSTISSTFSLIYHNPCWNLEFAANKTPDDTGFYLIFTLSGISSGVDFEL